LRQHWADLKAATEERDQLAAQANQVLNPKIKRYQMCLAQRAMAAEHAAAVAEERRLLLVDLEYGKRSLGLPAKTPFLKNSCWTVHTPAPFSLSPPPSDTILLGRFCSFR